MAIVWSVIMRGLLSFPRGYGENGEFKHMARHGVLSLIHRKFKNRGISAHRQIQGITRVYTLQPATLGRFYQSHRATKIMCHCPIAHNNRALCILSTIPMCAAHSK